MTILQFLIVGLFLVVVAISAVTAVNNWRTHQEWRREATQRGWRYTTVGWKQFSKPSYRIAGTTANGIVWELHRSMDKGKLRYSWQTDDAALPYGTLMILPEGGKRPLSKNLIPFKQKAASANPPPWPNKYTIYTTHNQLALRLVAEPVTNLLHQFPAYPQNGSLEKLIWK
ncbi:MAG: hypothetical protein GY805_33410, partial [Chloroflexi bacterium]|nr:hypothetical protein [Chloroflexota bacterium]